MNYNPPTKAELERARQHLKDEGKQSLANSYRQSHPGATENEVAAFAQGREPGPGTDSLDASIRKAHPEYTDKQVELFKRGR